MQPDRERPDKEQPSRGRPKRGMRPGRNKPGKGESRRGQAKRGAARNEVTALLPYFGTVALIAVALTLALNRAAQTLGPRPGDIIAFSEARLTGSPPPPPLVVSRFGPDGTVSGSCVLDPAIMARSGGSLVVEGVRARPLLYRVRWGGRSTSQAGGASCPDGALLGLTQPDIESLAQSVGGFGLDGRRPEAAGGHAGRGERATYRAP